MQAYESLLTDKKMLFWLWKGEIRKTETTESCIIVYNGKNDPTLKHF